MPIHDWTQVHAGTWPAFHHLWISQIQIALNGGRLPPNYYAQAEQVVGPMGPDVLTLQAPGPPGAANGPEDGGLAIATAPPRVRLVAEAEIDATARRQRTVVVRHVTGDRVVAFLEIVSPGNKSAAAAFRTFLAKAVQALE